MATHETTVHEPERAGVRSFHFAKIKGISLGENVKNTIKE